MKEFWILLCHQILFQGMFVFKNITLQKKLGQSIRGANLEANVSVLWFIFFLGMSLLRSLYLESDETIWNSIILLMGCFFLGLSIVISLYSLAQMGNSWRVGVIESQKTKLITSGIYGKSRNPYFLSYLLVFAGNTLVLQEWWVLLGTIMSALLIHWMILKEERFLLENHGGEFLKYTHEVGRYFSVGKFRM